MSLGKRVRELRLRRGMSQKELAEASNISQATISRLEAGRVRELKAEAIKRLSSALGVTTDYLLGQTSHLEGEAIVRSDPTARYIFRGYEKLSPEGKKEVLDFVRFLEEKESKNNS